MSDRTVLLLLILTVFYCSSIESKPKFTFDEFFNSTYFPSVGLSPDGRYILVHSRRPAWNNNTFENSLWLYSTDKQKQEKTLITNQFSELLKPKWSPSGEWFLYSLADGKNGNKTYEVQLHNVLSDDVLVVDIGEERPTAIIWSNRDTTLYFATVPVKSTAEDDEWKDVIRYRQSKSNDQTNLHRLDIRKNKRQISVEITDIQSVPFLVGELLYSSATKQLIFSSVSALVERISVFELYSIDLRQSPSALKRLTDNDAIEQNIQLSDDGQQVFFQTYPLSLNLNTSSVTQPRLLSVDLADGHIERWAKDFDGSIAGYTLRSEGGVFILGQSGINVQIYIQQTASRSMVKQTGWNGSYQALSASRLNRRSSLVFTHSSFDRPEEIYFVPRLDQLPNAERVTNVNDLFNKRCLPQATTYQWRNKDDQRTIEGILHYPPGKFGQKKLPLLVLIHGGPSDASLNRFHANWYELAPMAATEGWLVFEPNYRGSIGYGDAFTNEVRFEVVSRPGKDILDGVDCLIADGIADPTQLTIGGFSYGGYLTNWLITQTTRFNAAVSGAGAVDQLSSWGLMDVPAYIVDLLGGFPWDVPQRYLNESAIFQLDKAFTPTHLVTGAEDIRVPASQSYILERGLQYLGIPSQLLVFPKAGHSLRDNPWHGKIKVREELKWLEKYGHTSFQRTSN